MAPPAAVSHGAARRGRPAADKTFLGAGERPTGGGWRSLSPPVLQLVASNRGVRVSACGEEGPCLSSHLLTHLHSPPAHALPTAQLRCRAVTILRQLALSLYVFIERALTALCLLELIKPAQSSDIC